MFKVGDYIFTNDDVAHYPYLIIAKKGEHYKLRSDKGVRYCREWRIDRIATEQEIAAGHRIDTTTGVTVITPKGVSKAKGGMAAFVDMGDDSHIENHISPLCKVGVK